MDYYNARLIKRFKKHHIKFVKPAELKTKDFCDGIHLLCYGKCTEIILNEVMRIVSPVNDALNLT